jgi:hypothetical protein
LIVALNGVVVVFVVGSLKLRTRVNRWVERNEEARARATTAHSERTVAADVE